MMTATSVISEAVRTDQDPVKRAIELVRQLAWCQQQLDQMICNVELARSKTHRITSRLEDEGVVPLRKAATECAFQKSLDDIAELRRTIDETMERVVSELRRCTAREEGKAHSRPDSG